MLALGVRRECIEHRDGDFTTGDVCHSLGYLFTGEGGRFDCFGKDPADRDIHIEGAGIRLEESGLLIIRIVREVRHCSETGTSRTLRHMSSCRALPLLRELPDLTLDDCQLLRERSLDSGGPPFSSGHASDVRSAVFLESQLAGDAGVDPAKEFGSVELRGRVLPFRHSSRFPIGPKLVPCCRNTVAVHGQQNIPIPIFVKEIIVCATKANALPVWAEKIRDARSNLLGMNQSRFAEVLGVTQSNVSKWESGSYPPAPDMFVKMGELLKGRVESIYFFEQAGLPKEYFEGTGPFENEKYSKRFAEKQIDVVQIPLLHDRAAAGAARTIDERDIDLFIPMLRSQLPPMGKIIAVRVKGDSMADILLEGYVVFINVHQRDPRRLVGHMVAAADDDGGVTIKWLRKSQKSFLLVPQHISQRHEVRVFHHEDDLRIVGEVVKWIGSPPPVRK
jgi:SOS-response transcriptional repressor LexA